MPSKGFSVIPFFLAGGIGDASAVCGSHPLDVVKVRQQLKGELSKKKKRGPNVIRTLTGIAKGEGVVGLYAGLSASILRQLTFSTMRHGGYAALCAMQVDADTLREAHEQGHHPDSTLGMHQRILAGCVAGFTSAVIANPVDVTLIRMQADGHWPPQARRNYSHVFQGLAHAYKTDGLASLWNGCSPCALRAMLVTSSQVPTYFAVKSGLRLGTDQDGNSKGYLESDDIRLHLISSIASAVVASVVTQPVDVVKTRMMNMQSAKYKSPMDCAMQTLRTEGPLAFYKGLTGTMSRLVPHTIALWMVQEQAHAALRRNGWF